MPCSPSDRPLNSLPRPKKIPLTWPNLTTTPSTTHIPPTKQVYSPPTDHQSLSTPRATTAIQLTTAAANSAKRLTRECTVTRLPNLDLAREGEAKCPHTTRTHRDTPNTLARPTLTLIPSPARPTPFTTGTTCRVSSKLTVPPVITTETD